MARWRKIALVLYWLAAPLIVGAVAQIVSGLPFTLTNGTVADATQVMADFNQIVNNVNANAAKNGVNSDITALSALATPITPTQGGTSVFIATGTAGGSANAQTIAATLPSTFALTTNYTVVFVPGNTNTGATTLTVNATTTKNVFKVSFSGPIALTGGEIVSGQSTRVTYDGTQYILQDLPRPFGVLTSLASAATTDLGTVASHMVLVTGTTGITSFGSSAQADFPVYYVTFNGSLTITAGANIVTPGGNDIAAVSNDNAIIRYNGGGVWRIISYTRNAGFPLSGVTYQVFTANGTYTPRAGLNYAVIECQAGGGSGAGGTGTAGTTNVGGGGGAGSYARVIATASAIGASQAVTVGAGGTAPAAGNTTGGAGGATSLGALCVVNPGQGGLAGSGTTPGAGGAGGSATGGSGPVGTIIGTGNRGGTGVSASIATIAAVGGKGSGSMFGDGGAGGVVNPGGATTATGAAGIGFGSGGGGGSALNSATTVAGGNGMPGFVLVTEF